MAFLAILILSAYCCSSAVHVESNSTPPCNGECQLLEDDMNPYIRRRLYNLGPAPRATTRPGEAAFPPCGPKDATPYCTEKLCRKRANTYRAKC